MRTIIICIITILTNLSIFAQNDINSVLHSIEENNMTLKMLRKNFEAQKLENKTGITLSDPEVGVGYMWRNPREKGNRTDFSVSQSFDIATITGMKSRLADSKNSLIDWQYRSDRMNILLEAKLYCIELVYCNALKKELTTRLQHAVLIAEGYKEGLEKGSTNILEYNKVKLNLSMVQGEMLRIEVERRALLSQLKRLNGGVDIVFDGSQYTLCDFPADFDEWYLQVEGKNPALAYAGQEIEVSKRLLSLSKANGLPAFSAGYMSEKESGERFHGISLGISLPLWANKNRVKQAKAVVRTAELKAIDTKQQYYSRLKILYERAQGLKDTAESYRRSLVDVNSTQLLKKALDAGHISLLDYILEIGLYYDTVNRTLEAERDFQKAFAEFSSVEL